MHYTGQCNVKLHPLLLSSAILDLAKRVFEKINLGVCFRFFLRTACQSITDELRETERVDQRHKYIDCQSRVPDGFARALPADGGLSGPNDQLLRACHEHHQHHHDCMLSSDVDVLRSALFGCEARPFPSLPPGRPYSLPKRVAVSS
jgi:hypothetical protein